MRSATWWCLSLVMLGCSDPPSVTAPDASPDVIPDVASPDVSADTAPDIASDTAPDVIPDVAPVVDAPAGACGRMPPRTGQWYETLRSGGVERTRVLTRVRVRRTLRAPLLTRDAGHDH